MPDAEQTEIESIFDEIVLIEDTALRHSRLIERCNGNNHLFERVKSLLKAYSQSDFLESSAIELAGVGNPPNSSCGVIYGNYVLSELLAYGGMGEVYTAQHCSTPHSHVAFKLLAADWNTRHGRARFTLEQDLLRKLDHPGIVRLIEDGRITDGRPYIVMELVRGLPIDQFCDRAMLSIRKRIELIIQTCEAIQHVHDLGIVHRDLKPENILVQLQDGQPQVKIIDFGVAKFSGDRETVTASLTSAEQILGTPAYMSPEQLDWSADVSQQSDIYSIGAILSKLLIGTTPLDARLRPEVNNDINDDNSLLPDLLDIQKLRQALLHEEPARPSQILAGFPTNEANEIAQKRNILLSELQQEMSKHLDWVVLKAISPLRSDRYTNVLALSTDLQAVLENRPTSARPPSMISRISKWSKRNSNAIKNTAISCLVMAGLLGFLWGRIYFAELEKQTDTLASEQRSVQQKLQERQFVADLRLAANAIFTGNGQAAHQVLDKYLIGQVSDPFHTFAHKYLLRQHTEPKIFDLGHQKNVGDMDMSPDGKWIVTGDNGGEIRIQPCESLGKGDSASIIIKESTGKEIHKVRFSPDGKFLAATGQDRKVRLWRTESWDQYTVFQCWDMTVNSLAWSPDSKRLVAGDRKGRFFAWDIEKLEIQRDLPVLTGPLRAITWAPDGRTVAIAEDTKVSLWNPDNWQCHGRIERNSGVITIVFSPDSKTLAIGDYSMGVTIVDVQACEILQELINPLGVVWSLAFHENHGLFVSYSTGHLSYFYRLGQDRPWRGTRDAAVVDSASRIVRSVISKDGSSLWLALHEERKLVNVDCLSVMGFTTVDKNRQENETSALEESIKQNGFKASSDCLPAYHKSSGTDKNCDLVAIAGNDENGSCIVLSRKSDNGVVSRIESPDRIRQLMVSPDGNRLLFCGPDPMTNSSVDSLPATFVYEFNTRLTKPIEWPNDGSECRACFVDSGKRLIVGVLRRPEIACIESDSGKVIKVQSLSANFQTMHASSDGERIFVGQTDRMSCFTSDLSRQLWSVPLPEMVTSIADLQDGRTIACLSLDGRIRLLDTITLEMLYEMPFDGPDWPYEHHRFWLRSPDPNTLVLDGFEMSKSVQFWGDFPRSR